MEMILALAEHFTELEFIDFGVALAFLIVLNNKKWM